MYLIITITTIILFTNSKYLGFCQTFSLINGVGFDCK